MLMLRGQLVPTVLFPKITENSYFLVFHPSNHIIKFQSCCIYPKKMSTMNFCRKCNNILYPKQDIEHKTLLYSCAFCDHQEAADNSCIYRSDIHHSAGERTQALQDVDASPSHPRTKSVRCARCNHGETGFYQATCKGEEGKVLFFECCSPTCGHKWRA